MRRKQRTARAPRLQQVRTCAAGTSKDGEKVNREPDRYTVRPRRRPDLAAGIIYADNARSPPKINAI
uniref:Uncharacterized protein n=2 Tax=Rhizobium/Agrobacterium group TaxID=227290 RepID=A0A2Z2PLN6_AGRTU|nr:hypothetical protein [Rhizobium rhizogenes]ASK41286.1 hypothetical protein [Agrobacterium tumefaciens]ASK41749.1 hypothetical protein [Agrobacterium tumefaciens]